MKNQFYKSQIQHPLKGKQNKEMDLLTEDAHNYSVFYGWVGEKPTKDLYMFSDHRAFIEHPVKVFTRAEIRALERKMKKEGRL